MWRRTVIDLTALLDVILILLFLVLNSASIRVEAIQETAAAEAGRFAQLEAAYESVAAENDRLNRTVDSFSALQERARVITLYIEGGVGGGARGVYVESEGVSRRFTLNWDNAAVVERALISELTRLCTPDETQRISFLALRYDRHKIYQADYELLSRAVTRVKQACGDVYSAEYDIKEKDDGNERPIQ